MRFRGLLLLLLIQLAGCSLLVPQPDAGPPTDTAEPVSGDTAPSGPALPEPPPPARPDPAPVEPPETAPEPAPSPLIAIVLSNRAPAYENVAIALSASLDRSEVYDLGDRSLLPREAFARIAESEAAYVVAIGLRAAIYARDHAAVPVIFSQVFNVAENRLSGEHLRGVAALPPLDKQLDAWRERSPGISSIGAIVGAGHDSLIAEARQAADSSGIEFHYRVASSDRETLYLFNRLVPDIDAFWLFPDNRVLSAAVLKDMLAYAAKHAVEVAVFNDALLTLGPALSTTTDESDIANVVVDILARLHAGELQDVPALSPLTEVRIGKGPVGGGQAAERPL